MDYSKNTIIGSKSLPAEILNTMSLKLVVLTPDSGFIDLADPIAQQNPMGIDRYVVWLKDPDAGALQNQLSGLEDNLEEVVAFSLSTTNKPAAYIRKGDLIDMPGIDYAFVVAGEPQYNT